MAILLGLGSNLGDRTANLQAGLEALDALEKTSIIAVSQRYETEPIGVADQPQYLNIVAEIETAHKPLELLNAIKSIEESLGRTPSPRWGPRIIDIDIILWDDLVVESDEIMIPHTEFRNRAFVLAPMAEIAGHVIDPVTQLTVSELSQRPEAVGRVDRLDKLDH